MVQDLTEAEDIKKRWSSPHWEQLSCHSPSSPENVRLRHVRLHPLLDQENLHTIEPITVCSGGKTTRDTDRWEPQQLGSSPPPPDHLTYS